MALEMLSNPLNYISDPSFKDRYNKKKTELNKMKEFYTDEKDYAPFTPLMGGRQVKHIKNDSFIYFGETLNGETPDGMGLKLKLVYHNVQYGKWTGGEREEIRWIICLRPYFPWAMFMKLTILEI
jgi:hypothetical protein